MSGTGTGCTFTAAASGATNATSSTFNVTAPAGEWTLIQSVPATMPAVAVPGVGAGHVLTIQVATNGFPVTLVSDNNGDTCVHATNAQAHDTPLSEYVDSFYCLQTNAGSPTVTATSSASFIYMMIREWSYAGSSANLAFDVANHSTDGSTGSATSLSLTTAATNELVIGMAISGTGTVTAAPAGWADLVTSANAYNTGIADLADSGAVGVKNANFTLSTSGSWLETVMAIRDRTTSSGPVPAAGRISLLGVGR
jgi:hypothetical protein